MSQYYIIEAGNFLLLEAGTVRFPSEFRRRTAMLQAKPEVAGAQARGEKAAIL